MKKSKLWKRIIATVLTLVVTACMLPLNSWSIQAASDTHPNMITITVVDENGPVEGAEVDFTVDSIMNGMSYITKNEVTDENGCIDIMSSSDFAEDDLTLTAVVSKEGYRTDDTTILNKLIRFEEENFEVVLESSAISDIIFPEPKALTYNNTEQTAYEVTGMTGDHITYKIKKENETSYVDCGEELPTVREAGAYNIVVTISRDGYDDLIKEVTVTVNKADVSIGFNNYTGTTSSEELKGEVPYNKTYDFSASDKTGLSGGAMTYGLELSEPEIAEIDSNGILKVEYPGTITIIAKLSEDDNCNEKEIRYTLNISGNVASRGQYISFADEHVSYVLGTSGIISNQKATPKNSKIKGTITYKSDNIPGISCDKNTGELRVTDYDKLAAEIRKANGLLEVSVTATKDARGFYGEDSVTYKLSIEFAPMPASTYVLEGTKGQKNGIDTEWYISDVAITAVEPEVYDIAADIPNNFAEEVVFRNEGRAPRYVYLKDKTTGGITDRILVDVAIDKIRPIVSFAYDSTAQKIICKVTEANFRAEDILVTGDILDIKGNPVSGISVSDITRKFQNPNMWKADVSNDTYICEMPLDDSGFYDLKVDYSDIAGWEAESVEPDILMVDHDAPTDLQIEYSKSILGTILERATMGFYNPKVTVTFTAYDTCSGVDSFVWSYVQENGTSAVNTPVASMLNQKVKAVQDPLDKSRFTANITLTATEAEQLRGSIRAAAIDAANNSSNTVTDEGYIYVVDTKKPVMNVSYSQEVAKENVTSTSYYNSNATVTFRITEANFWAEDVNITISKNGGTPYSVKALWKNENADIHVGTYTLTEDGNYMIQVEYTDRSGNKMNSYTSHHIVVDKTKPLAEVNQNSAVKVEGNLSYYDGNVEAAITVQETNFNASAIKVMVSKDGAAPYPVTPNWTSNGLGIHIGTFSLTEDGEYTIIVSGSDYADNAITEYSSDVLIVDTAIETPHITINGREEDGKAYKDELVPAVSFEDENYEDYEIRLTRTRYGVKDEDVTEQFIGSEVSINENGGSGTFDTFDKIADNDGIYTLNLKMTDKAGHESDKTVMFTANRYGSVYEYSDYLVSLIENGGAYVNTVTEDLVITEYNADRLVGDSLNIEITRDGKPLEDAHYEVSQVINDQVTVGESGWYQYDYTISKDNFVQDGIYKISISSKDATGNEPENSNYEDKNILFRVDNVAPEITSITGLEKEFVNAQEVTVKYTVYDTIGLKAVRVYVDDVPEGEAITDFSSDLNNYEGSFVIHEKTDAQRVRIEVEDLAGNITDTDSEDFSCAYTFNRAVIVSTNAMVRWYANKVLFWGTIGGGAACIGVIIGLVAWKRRKK